jgi:hypothetical protein
MFSAGDAFLALVIGAFSLFGVVLALASREETRIRKGKR